MHIVVIDDEKVLSAGIEKKLLQEDYKVTVLNSYGDFLNSKVSNADLYLVDVSLGDGSGFDIIASLRKESKTKSIPILLMSGHDDVGTKVEGLDVGADDYIVKPFNPKELLARVRSALRRREIPIHENIVEYGNYSYNYSRKEITYNNSVISLTKKERQILEIFFPQKNILITKESIVDKLWSKSDESIAYNTVNVTICNLRKKLGTEFKLETKVGLGYILQE